MRTNKTTLKIYQNSSNITTNIKWALNAEVVQEYKYEQPSSPPHSKFLPRRQQLRRPSSDLLLKQQHHPSALQLIRNTNLQVQIRMQGHHSIHA